MLSVSACILVSGEGESPLWRDSTLDEDVSSIVAAEQVASGDTDGTLDLESPTDRVEPATDDPTVVLEDALPTPRDDAFAINDDQQLGGSVLTNDLAKDVQRYLDDEPVEACPPSASYRLKKFTRRHKTGIATAATVTVALLLGLAGASWQAIVATEARDFAEEQQDIAEQQVVQTDRYQLIRGRHLACIPTDDDRVITGGKDAKIHLEQLPARADIGLGRPRTIEMRDKVVR